MNSKLKLDLDQLTVDSFDTSATDKPRGTVFGEQCTCWTACGQNTCPGCPTCDASCNGTCAGTCAASCNGTCNCPSYDYTCDGCTNWDVTCRNIGTCNPFGGTCPHTP
jgi:hypothetical protein